MPWRRIASPAGVGRGVATGRGTWRAARRLRRFRNTPLRSTLWAVAAVAATAAAAATFPIDLRPDWGDLQLGAQTGTIESYRPIAYVILSNRDARAARCQVTFDMHVLLPKVFRFRLAPGGTRNVYYNPPRAINRMIIAVHCIPLPDTAEPAPETR